MSSPQNVKIYTFLFLFRDLVYMTKVGPWQGLHVCWASVWNENLALFLSSSLIRTERSSFVQPLRISIASLLWFIITETLVSEIQREGVKRFRCYEGQIADAGQKGCRHPPHTRWSVWYTLDTPDWVSLLTRVDWVGLWKPKDLCTRVGEERGTGRVRTRTRYIYCQSCDPAWK
jgi:hypothetical protein